MSKEESAVMRPQTSKEKANINCTIAGQRDHGVWRSGVKGLDEVSEAAREHHPDELGKSPARLSTAFLTVLGMIQNLRPL
jgi:hypothetical protein